MSFSQRERSISNSLLVKSPLRISSSVPSSSEIPLQEWTQWNQKTNFARYYSALLKHGYNLCDPKTLSLLTQHDIAQVLTLAAAIDSQERQCFAQHLHQFRAYFCANDAALANPADSVLAHVPLDGVVGKRKLSSLSMLEENDGESADARAKLRRVDTAATEVIEGLDVMDDCDASPGDDCGEQKLLSQRHLSFAKPLTNTSSKSECQGSAEITALTVPSTPTRHARLPPSVAISERALPVACWEWVGSFLTAPDFFMFVTTCKHLHPLGKNGPQAVVDLCSSGTNIQDMVLGRFFAWKRVSALDLSHCRQLTDEGLQWLHVMTSLRQLDVPYTKLTDASLAYVKKMNLIKLNVSYCTLVTDIGLKHLSEMKSLEALDLCYCNITDAGLAHLSSLSRLVVLLLVGCTVTDAGLMHIRNLTLKKMAFARTITDAGLRHIQNMQLTHLRLNGCAVTDAGMQVLENMPLEFLDLGATQVTDVGMQPLVRMPLRFLRLSGCNITDNGLSCLHDFANIELLDISRCVNITARGLVSLQGTQLSRLVLNDCVKITDEGLRVIKDLPLTYLELGRCSVTDRGLAFLRNMPLVSLRLHGCPVSDCGLLKLARHTHLRYLDVRKCTGGVSIRGLAYLKTLPPLRHLVVALHEDLVAAERDRLADDWFSLWACEHPLLPDGTYNLLSPSGSDAPSAPAYRRSISCGGGTSSSSSPMDFDRDPDFTSTPSVPPFRRATSFSSFAGLVPARSRTLSVGAASIRLDDGDLPMGAAAAAGGATDDIGMIDIPVPAAASSSDVGPSDSSSPFSP